MYTPITYATSSQYSPLYENKKRMIIDELSSHEAERTTQLGSSPTRVTMNKREKFFGSLDERITKLETNLKRYSIGESPITRGRLDNNEKVYELNERVRRLEDKVNSLEYENSRRLVNIEDQLTKLTLLISKQPLADSSNIGLNVYNNLKEEKSQASNNYHMREKPELNRDFSNNGDKDKIKLYNESNIGNENDLSKGRNKANSQNSPDIEKKSRNETIENLRNILRGEKDRYKSNIAKLKDADITNKVYATHTDNTPKLMSRRSSIQDIQKYNKTQQRTLNENCDPGIVGNKELETLTFSPFSTNPKYSSIKKKPNDNTYSEIESDITNTKPIRMTKDSLANELSKNGLIRNDSQNRFSKSDNKLRRSQEKITQEQPGNSIYNQQLYEQKKRQIDQEIDRRIQEEVDKRKKVNASVHFLNRIAEKIDHNQPTYIRNPYSTEKSREKEVSARLQIERKMRNELISKFEKAASRSISKSRSPHK